MMADDADVDVDAVELFVLMLLLVLVLGVDANTDGDNRTHAENHVSTQLGHEWTRCSGNDVDKM